ncbi:response regulator transcription factor [Paenibacillus guangzhouensis]|uniref:response regulator transcription factor n=1 Tax=Paenibacillus guangzhouensis TaxID=1473112 RepID=UPI00187B3205|nr:response regulator [Paenibacillus guangzhouensis]
MLRPNAYTVVVAEDEQIILEHIVEKVERTDPGFQVIATAMNGEDALELVKRHQPDILFTDVKMPLMDGIELTRHVKKLYPETHIVILSGYDNFTYARQALKLGVMDYLLKPMTGESLQDTLDEIKSKLDQRNQVQERNILTQDLNGLQSSRFVPASLENGTYMLYLVCLGNLYRYAADDIDAQYINKLWGLVDWAPFMATQLEPQGKWWVIDDKRYNVKFLITTSEHLPRGSAVHRATGIQDQITAYMEQAIPVTLCTHHEPVPLRALWETAQGLRRSLDKGLIPCQSSIILLHDTDSTPNRTIPLAPITVNAIEMYVKQRKFDLLRLELSRLFEEWKQHPHTQHALEKTLIQLTRLLFEALDDPSRQTVSAIESGIYHIAATAKYTDALYENMLRLIIRHLPVHKKTDSAEELYILLEEYIRLHFTEAINVEHLADKFQFNPSYIIRVFKKYKGVPPLQYLISLRIQEAKRLIEAKPSMDFKDISEIIGYTDQHYFSRVFRNVTGMTPSEYRDSIRK